MKEFNDWDFIEKWLPDYYQNEDVAYSDALDCYIHGVTENSQYYVLKERFPDIEDAIIEQKAVDSQLFYDAWQNYSIHNGKILEQKREEAKKNQQAYTVQANLLFTKDIKACDSGDAIEIAYREIIANDILGDRGYALVSKRFEILD